MHKQLGITLLQLLISISILCSLTAIAMPSYGPFLAEMKTTNELHKMQRLIFLARNNAINFQTNVTLCPLVNGQCSTQWQQDLTVFFDHNKDKIQSGSNELSILIKRSIPLGDRLQYAKTRTAITFGPTGKISVWGANGTFKYCPKGFEELSRGLIVSVTGKSYLTQDFDQDNQDEYRSGKHVKCL